MRLRKRQAIFQAGVVIVAVVVIAAIVTVCLIDTLSHNLFLSLFLHYSHHIIIPILILFRLTS